VKEKGIEEGSTYIFRVVEPCIVPVAKGDHLKC
jgi:hypothetical protein